MDPNTHISLRLKQITSEREKCLKLFEDMASVKRHFKEQQKTDNVNIMVPIGSKALLRGKLKSSDTVLVAQYDNFYIQSPMDTALRICEHREQSIKASMGELDTEERKLKDELIVLEATFEGKCENIHETEEELAEWREKHKERVRQHKQREAEERKKQIDNTSDMEVIESLNREIEIEELEREIESMGLNMVVEENSEDLQITDKLSLESKQIELTFAETHEYDRLQLLDTKKCAIPKQPRQLANDDYNKGTSDTSRTGTFKMSSCSLNSDESGEALQDKNTNAIHKKLSQSSSSDERSDIDSSADGSKGAIPKTYCTPMTEDYNKRVSQEDALSRPHDSNRKIEGHSKFATRKRNQVLYEREQNDPTDDSAGRNTSEESVHDDSESSSRSSERDNDSSKLLNIDDLIHHMSETDQQNLHHGKHAERKNFAKKRKNHSDLQTTTDKNSPQNTRYELDQDHLPAPVPKELNEDIDLLSAFQNNFDANMQPYQDRSYVEQLVFLNGQMKRVVRTMEETPANTSKIVIENLKQIYEYLRDKIDCLRSFIQYENQNQHTEASITDNSDTESKDKDEIESNNVTIESNSRQSGIRFTTGPSMATFEKRRNSWKISRLPDDNIDESNDDVFEPINGYEKECGKSINDTVVERGLPIDLVSGQSSSTILSVVEPVKCATVDYSDTDSSECDNVAELRKIRILRTMEHANDRSGATGSAFARAEVSESDEEDGFRFPPLQPPKIPKIRPGGSILRNKDAVKYENHYKQRQSEQPGSEGGLMNDRSAVLGDIVERPLITEENSVVEYEPAQQPAVLHKSRTFKITRPAKMVEGHGAGGHFRREKLHTPELCSLREQAITDEVVEHPLLDDEPHSFIGEPNQPHDVTFKHAQRND